MMEKGFWEPHSSSVDFCEPNYAVSSIVVEFHNVWSSFLGISAFGLMGLVQTTRNKHWQPKFHPLSEWRTRISFVTLALTGLGSAGLHGTLHWIFQSSDELPMMFILFTHLFCSLEVDAPVGSNNYPFLPFATVAIGVLNTFVYYTFQDIYLVFIATFSSGVALVIAKIVFMLKNRRHSRTTISIFYTGLKSYLLVGSVSWVLDMVLCERLIIPIANDWSGITPHIVWHFAAGLGSYCTTLFLVCSRCEALGCAVDVSYVFGIIPFLYFPRSPSPSMRISPKSDKVM